MNSGVAVSFVLLFSGLAAEGGTLKGVVQANQEGGPPVSQVKISALGANPTETGEGGSFVLQFPNAQPGDVVNIVVDKPGFRVVNYVQLRVVLPKNPDAEVLRVLLCKEGQYEEFARRFYRLKSLDAVNRTFGVQVRNLHENNQQNEAAMTKLREERDQAIATAEKSADEVARLKPGDTSSLYAEATNLFINGRVKEALQILDEEKLRRSIVAAEALKAESDKAVANAVQSYLLKARLLITQFQFGEAEKVYESVTQAAPDNQEGHFAFGLFYQSLNNPTAALREYELALQIAQGRMDGFGSATILNNLGNLEQSQGRYDNARKDYEGSLEGFNRHREDAGYLVWRAVTEINLGTLDHAQNRQEDARKDYEDALGTLGQLGPQGSAMIQAATAGALRDLGLLASSQGLTGEARGDFDSALSIFRELARQDPDGYLPSTAQTLANLFDLDGVEKKIELARVQREESLDIYRQLGKIRPGEYTVDIGSALNDLGRVDLTQKHLADARKNFEAALKAVAPFADQNPNQYSRFVALTRDNLALLDEAEGSSEAAKADYRKEINIYDELSKSDPGRYAAELANAKAALAKLDISKAKE